MTPINTLQAVRLFNVLAKTKVSKMKDRAAQFAVLRVVNRLRPVADAYQTELQAIREAYRTVEVSEAEEQMNMLRLAMERKEAAPVPMDKVREYSTLLNQYAKDIRAAEKELLEATAADIHFERISENDLIAFISGNELESGEAALLMEYFNE